MCGEICQDNKVLSGVSWMIFRVFRTGRKLIVESQSVADFDTHR